MDLIYGTSLDLRAAAFTRASRIAVWVNDDNKEEPSIHRTATALLVLWLRRPPCERKIRVQVPLSLWQFSGSSHTSDFKIGTPVATLPGAWHYRVSPGTGWPCVNLLWLGEIESLICNFYTNCSLVWKLISAFPFFVFYLSAFLLACSLHIFQETTSSLWDDRHVQLTLRYHTPRLIHFPQVYNNT